jgi:hypothetical protein
VHINKRCVATRPCKTVHAIGTLCPAVAAVEIPHALTSKGKNFWGTCLRYSDPRMMGKGLGVEGDSRYINTKAHKAI